MPTPDTDPPLDCWRPDADPETLLRNLLTTIYRDDGRYAAEHGLAESCRQAAEIVEGMNQTLDFWDEQQRLSMEH